MIKISFSFASPSSITFFTFFPHVRPLVRKLQFNLFVISVENADNYKLIFIEITLADIREAVLHLLNDNLLQQLSSRGHNLSTFVVEHVCKFARELGVSVLSSFRLFWLVGYHAWLTRVRVNDGLSFLQMVCLKWFYASCWSSGCTVVSNGDVVISLTHF